jgi:hypothetical protein
MNKRQNRKTVDRFKYSPGELWYADVSGPFEPSLIYRNIYKVVFVDSYTRLTVIDFIGSKDDKSILEVLSEFTKVHVAFALAQGVNPVFIQSDNGEFDSSKVKFFCISHGLVQRFSPPYHSITNGPVERMIRKVKEMGRAMMIEKSMPQEYWEWAASAAVYISNRLPVRYENEWIREPLYLMYGLETDYSRWRVMFSVCYVLKRPFEMRKDWMSRGIKSILVGMTDSTYSVPQLQKVIQSSDVIVDEGSGEQLGETVVATMVDVDREYEVGDFRYLIGLSHIDDENGLEYVVKAVRKHGRYIVADRFLKDGGVEEDAIFALDAARLTGVLPDQLTSVSQKTSEATSARAANDLILSPSPLVSRPPKRPAEVPDDPGRSRASLRAGAEGRRNPRRSVRSTPTNFSHYQLTHS